MRKEVLVTYTFHAKTGKGLRQTDQDRFWTQQISDTEYVFLVCSGVGDHIQGRKAAEIAVRTVPMLLSMNRKTPRTREFFEKVLRELENTFTAYIYNHSGYLGMGVVLSLLFLEGKKAHIFWVGDCRIFQFRKGLAVYQTEDHTLGALMVHNGLIAPESIEYYHQKHILLNCVTGSVNPTDYDYQVKEDIRKGDLFLICTDGLTGTLSDFEITGILFSHSLPKALQLIEDECQKRSDDVFTFIAVNCEDR
jgi:serine/threonine protein phosphatase PrpC